MSRAHTSTHAADRTEGGNAFVEILIVLPWVLLIIYAGLEIAGTLSAIQAANYISREVSTLAFRRCALDEASGGTITDPASHMNADRCLAEVLAGVRADFDVVVPGIGVNVSLYNYSNVGGTMRTTRTGGSSLSGMSPSVNDTTFASDGSSKIRETFEQAINMHRSVVVSEVSVPLSSVTGSLLRNYATDLFGLTQNGRVYAITVI